MSVTRVLVKILPLFLMIFWVNPSIYFIGLNWAWFGNFIAPKTLKGRSVEVVNSLWNPRELTASFSNFIFSNSLGSVVYTKASWFSKSQSIFSFFIIFLILFNPFSLASKYCFAKFLPRESIKYL